MKKNLFRILMVTLMAAALLVTFTGCGDDRTAELESENAALRKEVEVLTAQVEELMQAIGLKDWNTKASAWSDGSGANIQFSATPLQYTEDQGAALVVMLGGQEATSVDCAWDGTNYVATVDLAAMDGYSYYFVLSSTDGIQKLYPLNVSADLMDLGSSLTSYCTLMVEDYEASDSKLTLTSGYIQVQLPRISATGESITCVSAELILQLNGEDVERQSISLSTGEAAGSYALDLSGVSFAMPEMEDDYQLDLWLEVTQSDGQTCTASGGSWCYFDGSLDLFVG